MGQANSTAIDEGPIDVFDVKSSEVDTELVAIGQSGSCGFSVVIPHLPGHPSQNFGMCHHFTWDGKHCVRSGLSSEHANRCAGCLCTAGAVPDPAICKVVGAHAPTTCAKTDSLHIEAVCCPPLKSR